MYKTLLILAVSIAVVCSTFATATAGQNWNRNHPNYQQPQWSQQQWHGNRYTRPRNSWYQHGQRRNNDETIALGFFVLGLGALAIIAEQDRRMRQPIPECPRGYRYRRDGHCYPE